MNLKILLVEDDELLSDTIIDFLSLNNIKCDNAKSVSCATDLLFKSTYDLALLDIKLADGNGIGLLKEIRAWNKQMPILMLTSYTDAAKAKECLMHGADDYIRKPFDIDELFARIQASCRRSYAKASNLIGLNNGYEFDIFSKRLLKDGQDANLLPKANELLAIFCMNKGQILTFETIDGLMWHASEEASNGSLRVYVGEIRKILGNDSIVNIKSIGYKLV